MMIISLSLLGLGLTCLIFSRNANGEYVEPSIWPQPKSLKFGTNRCLVSSELLFKTSDGDIDTLTKAYHRYHDLIFIHELPAGLHSSALGLVAAVKVTVNDRSEASPQLSTDESYTLNIQSSIDIQLVAETVYGALRGLESLSQLIQYDFDEAVYYIPSTPIYIEDAPRYAHRGLLLDTARHYEPIPMILQTLDALSYAKYNVFHWHVVDTQSFPIQSNQLPKLWEGAYTKNERYSLKEVAEVVEYARLRGIKVMIEFDMPGHAASWCVGYPEICPAAKCQEPLNPASNVTFPLISTLLSEMTGLFPYGLVHLGGDEVDYTCWEINMQIKRWEKEQGFSGSEDTYEYFVDKVANIARDVDRLPVQWVEVFEHFGNKLNNDTIVHVWKEKETLDQVLQAGYRSLLSNQGDWYLDHLDTSWKTMYLNEPTDGLSASSDPNLILGGESCMWGETVDGSDLHNTIWPRAAAVGEVLWTAYDTIHVSGPSLSDEDLQKVEDRLQSFRCLLIQRGIGAAPVDNVRGRSPPPRPGSCYSQR